MEINIISNNFYSLLESPVYNLNVNHCSPNRDLPVEVFLNNACVKVRKHSVTFLTIFIQWRIFVAILDNSHAIACESVNLTRFVYSTVDKAYVAFKSTLSLVLGM